MDGRERKTQKEAPYIPLSEQEAIIYPEHSQALWKRGAIFVAAVIGGFIIAFILCIAIIYVAWIIANPPT